MHRREVSQSAVDNVEIDSLIPTTIELSYYSHVYSYGARVLSISRGGSVIKQIILHDSCFGLTASLGTECKSTESKMDIYSSGYVE